MRERERENVFLFNWFGMSFACFGRNDGLISKGVDDWIEGNRGGLHLYWEIM